MGRNKDLRKKLAGLEAIIKKHQTKIRKEQVSAQPREELIVLWQRQIEAYQERASRLTRRLQRDW